MPDSIPYITLRDGELDVSNRDLVLRHRGGSASLGIPATTELAYADERAEDRDWHGILYNRVNQHLDAGGWPVGRPDWAHVHPARQRECMSEMLCHYCKGQPSWTDAGFLFLDIAGQQNHGASSWPEAGVTYQPPLCLPHAKKAVDLCKHGHRNGGFTAMRARRPRWHGVLGTPYQESAGRPKAVRTSKAKDIDLIPFDHPQHRMFLGAQLALVLHDVTLVDLDAELTAANLT